MKVLANDGLSSSAREILTKAGLTVLDNRVAREHLPNFINDHQVDVLLVRSATQVRAELIDDCPSLKIIGRAGIGMDNIDVEYAIEKGLYIINTPKASCRSVAELVFAHFFTLARQLHESNRLMPLEGDTKFDLLKKSFANAYELSGKTLGIIGFGKIGKEVAKIGISLGMKIIAYNRTPITEQIQLDFFDGQHLNFDVKTSPMEDVLKQADFISINTSKTTDYIIDHVQFEMMKDGVFLVNASRGGSLNEVALIDHIDNGKVLGAALDVFENEPNPELPLLMNPALSLSPHIGGQTIDAQDRIGVELAEQIINIKKELE